MQADSSFFYQILQDGSCSAEHRRAIASLPYHLHPTGHPAAILTQCSLTPMSQPQVFEQTISIQASATDVERCITDQGLMHRWLNPALRCEPVGEWNTDLGGQSRFMIQVPFWHPSLLSTVVERQPGLIVWQFEGFFRGRDRWECSPSADGGTLLLNRFEFEVPNPIVQVGFNLFAARWTQQDMQAQLKRLRQVAETLKK